MYTVHESVGFWVVRDPNGHDVATCPSMGRARAVAWSLSNATPLLAALKATMALWDKHGLGDDDNESEPVYVAARNALRRASQD